MKRILCWLGLHDWEWRCGFENKIYPFIPYKYCKRCGKMKFKG